MDPDQLASSEASLSESILFSIEFISGFITVFKEFMHGISSLCIICHLDKNYFHWTSTLWPFTCPLLFPHHCIEDLK